MILPMPVWNFVPIGKLLPDQEIFSLSGNKKGWLPNWDMKYQKRCFGTDLCMKKDYFSTAKLNARKN